MALVMMKWVRLMLEICQMMTLLICMISRIANGMPIGEHCKQGGQHNTYIYIYTYEKHKAQIPHKRNIRANTGRTQTAAATTTTSNQRVTHQQHQQQQPF